MRALRLARSTKSSGVRPTRSSRFLLSLLVGSSLFATAALAQEISAPQLIWSSLRWQEETGFVSDEIGIDHQISLDPELQQATKSLLGRARPEAGAAALIEVATGRVLAAVEIGHSPEGSLLFEPIAPAASVFKLVTTIALYEHTNTTPQSKVCTKGGIRSITEDHLSPARGDGVVCSPFGHALGTSRNAAYALLATERLQQDHLLSVAEQLGFNRDLASDLSGHVGFLSVPTLPLGFARTAAGFENSRLSVLGGAQLALTIANDGVRRPLRFLASPDESTSEEPTRVFSSRSARRITKSMEFTVHSGTSHEIFVDEQGKRYLGPIQVAGKTGTLKPSAKSPTASWFVGFAPSQHPKVVVSVLLQNADLWHQKGNQVARDLLRVYFARQNVPGITSPLGPTKRTTQAAQAAL